MDRRFGEPIVSKSDVNLRPVFRRASIIYVCQTIATIERLSLDTRHTTADRHAPQTPAIIERTIADNRYAVRDRNTRQTIAITERHVADTRHAVWNRDTR